MGTRKRWSPERRDVIWIDCNPQAGRKMKNFHPLLVLSPKSFNERTGMVIGLPMTMATYNDTNPFAIRFVSASGGIGYILAHQPKSFDWKCRGAKAHPMKQAPEDVFVQACEALSPITQ